MFVILLSQDGFCSKCLKATLQRESPNQSLPKVEEKQVYEDVLQRRFFKNFPIFKENICVEDYFQESFRSYCLGNSRTITQEGSIETR